MSKYRRVRFLRHRLSSRYCCYGNQTTQLVLSQFKNFLTELIQNWIMVSLSLSANNNQWTLSIGECYIIRSGPVFWDTLYSIGYSCCSCWWPTQWRNRVKRYRVWTTFARTCRQRSAFFCVYCSRHEHRPADCSSIVLLSVIRKLVSYWLWGRRVDHSVRSFTRSELTVLSFRTL